MLNTDGTQTDADREPGAEETCGPFPCEKELTALMSALKKLQVPQNGHGNGAIAVFHVFPDLSAEDWEQLAQKYRLEDWVAVPFDFTPEHGDANWRALFESALAKESLDPLTRLPNRTQFEARMKAEMQRASHTGTDLSVVVLDLDHARDLKKRFGSKARDTALVKMAETMRTCSRMYDLCARLTSDEFALVLPGTPPLRALAMAERLRDHMRAQVLSAENGEPFSLTFSAGIASLSQGPGISQAALVEKAEEALFEAKRQGRDRVLLAGDFSDYDTKVQCSEKLFLFFGDDESGDPSA